MNHPHGLVACFTSEDELLEAERPAHPVKAGRAGHDAQPPAGVVRPAQDALRSEGFIRRERDDRDQLGDPTESRQHVHRVYADGDQIDERQIEGAGLRPRERFGRRPYVGEGHGPVQGAALLLQRD